MQTPKNQINRKHSINENYFKNIKTEKQAYWLGFLWADGNLTKTSERCSGKNRLCLSQKTSEIKHLKAFLKEINGNYQIKTKKVLEKYSISTIHINSRIFCKTLEEIGFDIKEKRTNIPKISKKLIRHFIRGYFDGDGCLSIYVQNIQNKWFTNKQELSFTGNPLFIQNLKNAIENEINITKTIKIKTYKKTTKATSLRYGKKEDVDKIFHYLYDNSTIYLKSKYNKFIEFYSRLK